MITADSIDSTMQTGHQIVGLVRLDSAHDLQDASFTALHHILFVYYLELIRFISQEAARLYTAHPSLLHPTRLTLLLQLPAWFYQLPRTQTWKGLQSVLAHMYVTAANVAVSHQALLMDIDVLLIDSLPTLDVPLLQEHGTLYALARDSVCIDQAQQERLAMGKSPLPIHILDIPSSTLTPPSFTLVHQPDFSVSTLVPNAYEHVAVGGTFDHLHVGHKLLLTVASWLTSSRLVVGVSNMESLKKKTAYEYMESLNMRMKRTRDFLERLHWFINTPRLDYQMVPLSDPYGPTQHDPLLSCIVGSLETRAGCESVNTLRQQRHLPLLDIYTIDVVSDQDAHETDLNLKISSTAIRLYLKSLDSRE